jgi:hypothetical protein
MLLDKQNAELLKLTALYKEVPRRHRFHDAYLFNEANIERLQSEGLMYTTRDGRYYRASLMGYDLLQRCGYNYRPDVFRESARHVLTRREGCAQVAITLMLAGVDVFADEPQEYSYLSAATVRRNQRAQGRNLIGNTRFTGVTGSGQVFYYVADAQDALYYKYEISMADNLLPVRNAVVYMGQDYQTLCAAVTGPAGKGATYRTAYDKFTVPVHLCPCDPDGALQMRIMLEPDYRACLINMLYPVRGLAPPTISGCDGMRNGEPVLLGVDMDLRRIMQVVDSARKLGKTAHIFSRPCQTEALMGVIRNDGVCFYNITDDEIKETFGFTSLTADPPTGPYITKEGGYIGDQTLRACKEARKARGTKIQPVP